MVTLPFALSVHKFVNSVGADVGFASIFAVAILILLYFAHARETATLRERLDEAHARIGGLEARIAQLMHAQAAGQRVRAPGPVTPAPVTPSPVRPMGSAIASVRRVPNPATAAAAAPAAAGAGSASAAAPAPTVVGMAPVGAGAARSAAPGAPVGMAAPPLASATKLIPDPADPRSSGEPDDTMFVPAATAAAATNGKGSKTEPLTAATRALPAVAAAAARPSSASPRGAATAPPPPVKIGARSAATGASPPRRPSARQRPATVSLPTTESGRRSFGGRVLPLVIGGIAIVVIIAGLIIITNTGGSTSGNVPHGSNTANQTGAGLAHKTHSPPPFKASKYKVAVLNGTAVSSLAADVRAKLVGDGFQKGNATNAAAQTQRSTLVYYMPGAGAAASKVAAQHVAKSLNLAPTSVHPATQGSIASCKTSPTGTPLKSCGADVIVSVGADRASLATSASSG